MPREDLNIVIPANDPAGAKERLRQILSAAQRRAFALALFECTLEFFTKHPAAEHILVVTDSDLIGERAEAAGCAVVMEGRAAGETAAVERAAAWSVEHGFRSQLVIPGDMAELKAEEISLLLGRVRPDPCIILCPATGDDGTNAILTTPPDVIPFRFGDRSFPGYRELARERNILCRVLRLRSLALDLDTPDDLHAFLAGHAGHPARALLDQWNISTKS